MATDEVTKALVGLTEAMRVAGLARKTYVGVSFELEAADKVREVKCKRFEFDCALERFVQKLIGA